MAALDFTRRFDRLHGLAADRGGVDPRTLVGAWVNFDLTSKGVVEVAIAQQEADLTVRTFGACSPSPCDWGTVGAEAFAGVGDRDAVGFKAHYDFGSVDTLLVAYLNLRLLVVDSYTTFRDGSGRSRYFLRDHFYQV